MPYIDTKTSVSISKEQEAALAKRFGRAIELVPGKLEAFLTLNFTDNCRMYTAGSKNDIAVCDVAMFGQAPVDALQALSAELTAALVEILGLPAGNVNVKYSAHDHWSVGGNHL